MKNPLSGIRGRVTFTVLAVTAVLYSALAAVGFVQIANSGHPDSLLSARTRCGRVYGLPIALGAP